MSSLTVISWRFKMITGEFIKSVKPNRGHNECRRRSSKYLPHRGALLTNFYKAHDYLLHGDDKSLNRASELLGEIVQSSPEFTYARAEKSIS
ncbi:hypothetical protein [Escherichia coli]|uniref:hypothetical protein n=1 Tax=Escherichia coli TaxID=562 RepID=UPI00398130FD